MLAGVLSHSRSGVKAMSLAALGVTSAGLAAGVGATRRGLPPARNSALNLHLFPLSVQIRSRVADGPGNREKWLRKVTVVDGLVENFYLMSQGGWFAHKLLEDSVRAESRLNPSSGLSGLAELPPESEPYASIS